MFLAVPFTITKYMEIAKCRTTDKWIKKMWYLCTMEYYFKHTK